ncbi:hypothetical protein JCM9957A_08920 [Kineosporia succinea]
MRNSASDISAKFDRIVPPRTLSVEGRRVSGVPALSLVMCSSLAVVDGVEPRVVGAAQVGGKGGPGGRGWVVRWSGAGWPGGQVLGGRGLGAR